MTVGSHTRSSDLSLPFMSKVAGGIHRNEQGSSLIEFALSIGLLLTLLIGTMGVALELYADHFVASAARSAARYGMVRGSTWGTSCASTSTLNCTATSTDINNYVQSIAPGGVTLSSLAVSSSWPGTTPTGAACANLAGNNSPGCLLSVTVKYTFSFYIPFFGQDAATLTSTGAQAISQ